MTQRLAALALLAGFMAAVSVTAEPPRGNLTIEGIASIKYPSSPAWSPDGDTVAFLWGSAGKQDLFVAEPGGAPVPVTDLAVDRATLEANIGQFAWVTPTRIVYAHKGQLWEVSTTDRKSVRRAGIDGDGAFAISDDRGQIAFVRQNEILVSTLTQEALPVRVALLPAEVRASSLAFSRDTRYVAFASARSWPEVHPLPFNGTRLRSMRTATADRRLGIVAVHGGEPFWIPSMGDSAIVGWTAEGELVFEETSPDRKTRTIQAVAPGGSPRVIWSDADPAWFSPTRGPATVLSPDGRKLALFSDRSGWTHMYVASMESDEGAEPVQVTSGPFTVGYPAWSPDSGTLAYAHGVAGNQMERRLSIVDVASGRARVLVDAPGVHIFPEFSPDGRFLLYQRTAVDHSLDLYTIDIHAGGTGVRMTDSMPSGLEAADFTPPVAVSYPSRVDAAAVPATLMVASTVDRSRRHPAIVWIHGSGSDQNYLGWHPLSYRMYYAMHQYLAQQGYVILTPDYRGSSGYDREWATGNHLDLGGDDMRDVVSGVDYLRTLDFVDPDRICVWGLSYGGFMTLQAITSHPDEFQCAIDVAGVTDWGPRGGGWTMARLGTPAEHPEAYERSAPVRHMASLETPLLILHGTADVNVAFHDSLALFDALLKLGKPFETAIYPGEAHFFRRQHILRDAWHRVEDFFDRHLKP